MKLSVIILVLCFIVTSCAITAAKHRHTGTKHNNKGAVRTVTKLDKQQINSGILYGNIQIKYGLRDLLVKKIGSNVKFKVRTFSNGNFIVENLTPGNYSIVNIRANRSPTKIVLFKENIDFFSIYVGAAETVYAGSFKINVSKLKYSENKIMVQRMAIPNEKQVLQHVTRVEYDSIWFESLYFRMQSLI